MAAPSLVSASRGHYHVPGFPPKNRMSSSIPLPGALSLGDSSSPQPSVTFAIEWAESGVSHEATTSYTRGETPFIGA